MTTFIPIGIDLGTTFSCVGICRHIEREVELVQNSDGKYTTPSCVTYTEDDILVGHAALKKQTELPHNTIFDIKRLIGRKYTDKSIQENMKHWNFKIVQGENNEPLIEIRTGKNGENVKTIKPIDVLVELIKEMKNIALAKIITNSDDEKDVKAVITVPAHFVQSQKQSTLEAAKKAGLTVLELITEPAAAAFAHDWDKVTNTNEHVLVVDIGGGTTDTVVAEVNREKLKIKAIGGDPQLGGREFDKTLFDHFMAHIKEKYDKHPKYGDYVCDKPFVDDFKREGNRLRARQRLLDECIKFKESFANTRRTVFIFHMTNVIEDDESVIKLSSDEFNAMCQPLFDRIQKVIEKTISDAKMSPTQIDHIILVGGSGRIKKIEEILVNMFPNKKISLQDHPDLAIAKGATLRALQVMQGNSTTKLIGLEEATAFDLGFEVAEGRFIVVIPRNSKIPVKMSHQATTFIENQSDATFKIYEGVHQQLHDNNYLGSLTLQGITPGKAFSQSIDVTFELNESGILTVTASHNNKLATLEIEYINSYIPETSTGLNLEETVVDKEYTTVRDENEEERLMKFLELREEINKIKFNIDQCQFNETPENHLKKLEEILENVSQWTCDNVKASEKEVTERIHEIRSQWDKFMHGQYETYATNSKLEGNNFLSYEEYKDQIEEYQTILNKSWFKKKSIKKKPEASNIEVDIPSKNISDQKAPPVPLHRLPTPPIRNPKNPDLEIKMDNTKEEAKDDEANVHYFQRAFQSTYKEKFQKLRDRVDSYKLIEAYERDEFTKKYSDTFLESLEPLLLNKQLTQAEEEADFLFALNESYHEINEASTNPQIHLENVILDNNDNPEKLEKSFKPYYAFTANPSVTKVRPTILKEVISSDHMDIIKDDNNFESFIKEDRHSRFSEKPILSPSSETKEWLNLAKDLTRRYNHNDEDFEHPSSPMFVKNLQMKKFQEEEENLKDFIEAQFKILHKIRDLKSIFVWISDKDVLKLCENKIKEADNAIRKIQQSEIRSSDQLNEVLREYMKELKEILEINGERKILTMFLQKLLEHEFTIDELAPV